MYCSFAHIGHADVMWFIVLSYRWRSLHLLSVSFWNILVTRYLVCNAWSCTAIIPLSHSAFRSSLDGQRNVFSSPISCLYILLIYWSCISLLSHFLWTLIILLLYVFLCHCFLLFDLIPQASAVPLSKISQPTCWHTTYHPKKENKIFA